MCPFPNLGKFIGNKNHRGIKEYYLVWRVFGILDLEG
jgi:hypothetical protein